MKTMLMKRILIVSEHGVPVFDYKEYSRGDEVLVSGLITAILRFVEEIEKEKLSRVMLEESQFLLKTQDAFIFVFQISDQMPEEYAEYVSSCISDNFVENYKEYMKKFRGDVSVFRDFQEKCKEILLQCGIEIANTLTDSVESKNLRAWCLLSADNELLIVRANAPNYNIDGFTIFQVLGKSLQKVTSNIQGSMKSNSYHITHQGNIIQTICLPSSIIVMESKVDELTVKRFRQYKTKTHQQMIDLLKKAYEPDRTEIYNRSLVSPLTNKEISYRHKTIFDLFQAAEKGMQYLFNSPIHVQIFSTDKQTTLVVKLINRIFFLEFDREIATSKLLEATKKMFEQDLIVKDDIPEVMLEKS